MLKPPCVIDIEASGFGRRSYPIEVGYALPDGRAWCTLIRPSDHWTHWDAGAERVHGIARETLFAHGRAALDVALRLNADLSGAVAYCDGWAHDFPWLALLFDEAGIAPRFKLEPVTKLLPEPLLPRLPDAQLRAREQLGVTRHRASNDARALQRAVFEVLQGG
jgi:hypothetical protein